MPREDVALVCGDESESKKFISVCCGALRLVVVCAESGSCAGLCCCSVGVVVVGGVVISLKKSMAFDSCETFAGVCGGDDAPEKKSSEALDSEEEGLVSIVGDPWNGVLV